MVRDEFKLATEDEEVGYYAGFLASSIALANLISSYPWLVQYACLLLTSVCKKRASCRSLGEETGLAHGDDLHCAHCVSVRGISEFSNGCINAFPKWIAECQWWYVGLVGPIAHVAVVTL